MANPITLEKTGCPKIFLWGDYREKEDFDRYANSKKPEIRKVYSDLIDCTYKIVSSVKVGSGDIDLFRNAFLSNTKLIREKAGEKIIQFSHYFPEFTKLLDELAYDKRAAIRLRVIQSYWRDLPPQEQSFQILTSGLKDTSLKVREFAIGRIMHFNLVEFLPLLKTSLETETDTITREFVQYAVSLLEKGYYMKNLNERKVSVVFHNPKGLTGFFMDKEGLTEELIQQEIDGR